MTNRTRMLLTQVAYFRVGRLKDTEIAKKLNLSGPGLARILASPEYQDIEHTLFNNHVGKMDSALSDKLKALQGRLTNEGVPKAIELLLEQVMQRKDLKSAMSAAREILDRDPARTALKQGVNQSAGLGDSNAGQLTNIDQITGEAGAVGKEIATLVGKVAEA